MAEASPISVALNVLLMTAMAASLILWTRLLIVHRRDVAILPAILVPPRRRERPFWTPGDALVMFGSLQVIISLLFAILISQEWIDVTIESGVRRVSSPLVPVAGTVIAGIAASAITLTWLGLRADDAWDKLGLTFSLGDAKFGLRAALMLIPPVLLISAAAGYFVPYEHPVLDVLAGINSPLKFAVIFVATAIVTPLVEEFMFRVLLLGGLERLANPSAPFSSETSLETPTDTPTSHWQPDAWWPLVVSSLLFSLMHLGQGAAPIPLFFLAMGLGYLYRQTGNITAPVVVHMVLNSITLLVEVLK